LFVIGYGNLDRLPQRFRFAGEIGVGPQLKSRNSKGIAAFLFLMTSLSLTKTLRREELNCIFLLRLCGSARNFSLAKSRTCPPFVGGGAKNLFQY